MSPYASTLMPDTLSDEYLCESDEIICDDIDTVARIADLTAAYKQDLESEIAVLENEHFTTQADDIDFEYFFGAIGDLCSLARSVALDYEGVDVPRDF